MPSWEISSFAARSPSFLSSNEWLRGFAIQQPRNSSRKLVQSTPVTLLYQTDPSPTREFQETINRTRDRWQTGGSRVGKISTSTSCGEIVLFRSGLAIKWFLCERPWSNELGNLHVFNLWTGTGVTRVNSERVGNMYNQVETRPCRGVFHQRCKKCAWYNTRAVGERIKFGRKYSIENVDFERSNATLINIGLVFITRNF